MQIVFNRFREKWEEISKEVNVTVLARLTGYSKDVVRVALEKDRIRSEELKAQLEARAKEYLEKRKEEGQSGGTERRRG